MAVLVLSEEEKSRLIKSIEENKEAISAMFKERADKIKKCASLGHGEERRLCISYYPREDVSCYCANCGAGYSRPLNFKERQEMVRIFNTPVDF